MSEILVAPISGGCFGMQVAEMCNLCKFGYQPDICFAASGGTIAYSCASAGNWKPKGILEVASKLSSRVFIQKRESFLLNLIPDEIVCLLSGNMYTTNPNPENFMSKFFTTESIQKTELWIGAINKKTGRVGLFCNRDYNDSIIKGDYFNPTLYNSEQLRYFNGDIVNISRAIIASCSIPIMLNSTDIGKRSYVDCGTRFASPLTVLQNELCGIYKKNKELHITYISGYNVERKLPPGTIIGSTFSNITRGMVISDRSAACKIIEKWCDGPLMYGQAPISSLGEILKYRKKCTASLIELYPINSYELDIFDFTEKSLMKIINYSRRDIGIRIWWNGDKKTFSRVKNMLMTKLK